MRVPCNRISFKGFVIPSHPVMFQGEGNLFHRHMSLEDHPAGLEPHKAGSQTHDQRPVGGVFAAGSPRFSSEEGLEDAEHLLALVALIPA